MKALSVRQPYAGMIASGEKTIETRRWKWSYRGDLVIVSCARPKIGLTGHALAVVRMVDCRPMTRDDEAAARCELYPGAWAWVFEDVRPIEPFPVKGMLAPLEVPGRLVRHTRQHGQLLGVPL